jgi:predicted porin
MRRSASRSRRRLPIVAGLGVLAVLAGACGPAGAQGAITLYGIADAALEWSDADAKRAFEGAGSDASGGARMISGQPGNAKGSRLGLRGAEDLGGGLAAIFAIEHRLGLDSGEQANPAFWNGQAWVGLEGDWGRLTAGRQYTPMFTAMIAVDASSDQWYGTLVNSARYATRFDNSVEYRTPARNGLRAIVMLASDENLPDARDQYAIAALWASPSLTVSAAWQRLDAAGASGATIQSSAGLAWRLGPHQLGAGWMANDPAGGGQRVDHPYLSLRVAVGRGNVYANVVGSRFEAGGKDALMVALAWDWPLSRRTRLYVAGALDANVRLAGTLAGTVAYLDPNRYALGIRHDF